MDKKYDEKMLKDYERISSMSEADLSQMLFDVDLAYNYEVQDFIDNLVNNDRMDLVAELFIERPIMENAILAYINDQEKLLEALQEREKNCKIDVGQAKVGGGSRILKAKEDYEKSRKAISRFKRAVYLEEINEEVDREEILMEAEEEYSDYLDSLENYKMGDNPEIDNKINECLKQGYLPSYIDTILEDYGYTLSPEDLKEMYYKCGYEYDIESGASRKINESGKEYEYNEDFIDATDKKQMEFFLQKYVAQKESMEAELIRIKSKTTEMERDMYSTGGSEFDPEYHELFDLHDKIEELEEGIAKATESISFYESIMELHKKEEELSALEAEEKTISEAEALIDKQTEKNGQDIGEE